MDGEIRDTNALTLIHKDSSNRTLNVDGFGPNDGLIRERTKGGAVKATGKPCSCSIGKASTRRPDICSVCGGNADKRFHTEMDAFRERTTERERELVEYLKRAKAEAEKK